MHAQLAISILFRVLKEQINYRKHPIRIAQEGPTNKHAKCKSEIVASLAGHDYRTSFIKLALIQVPLLKMVIVTTSISFVA